jgi:hypothetical protein
VDFPLIEVMFVVTILTLISILVLLFGVVRLWNMNKKLDMLLKEEGAIKEELDITKLEEDQQLSFMKELVGELSSLHGIATKKTNYFNKAKKLISSSEVKKLEQNPEARGSFLNRVVDQLKKLDDISRKEDEEIDYIKHILNRLQK